MSRGTRTPTLREWNVRGLAYISGDTRLISAFYHDRIWKYADHDSRARPIFRVWGYNQCKCEDRESHTTAVPLTSRSTNYSDNGLSILWPIRCHLQRTSDCPAWHVITAASLLIGCRTSQDIWNTKANSTNLAIKGIIGIRAMSQISRLVGSDADSERYMVVPSCQNVRVFDKLTDTKQKLARQYASAWASSALAADTHILANFGDAENSSTVAYNLFAQSLLQIDVFNIVCPVF